MEKTPAVTAAYLARGGLLAAFVLVLSPVPSRGGGFNALDALVVSRLALFAALILSSAWVVLYCRRRAKGPGRPWVIGATALQLVGGPGYPLVNAGLLPQGFLTADLVFQGLALPVLNAAWGTPYAQLGAKRRVGLTAGSLGLAAVLVALYGSMPRGWSWCLSLAFPLASLPLLWLARVGGDPWRKPPVGLRSVRPSWRFLAGTLCAFAAANIMAGSAETGGFIEFGTIVAGAVFAACLLTVIGAVARVRGINLIAIATGVLLVLALDYMSAGLFIGQGGSMSSLKLFQHCSTMGLEQCLEALVWLVALESSQRTRINPVFTVGVSFLAIFTGRGVGSLIGMLVPLDPAALSILALFLFVPAMLFLGSEAFTAAPTEIAARPEASAAAVTAISAAYGLSPREQEVLALWADGNRIDYVAEQLCISKNTAKTHVTHIYRKTGTANREELLALLSKG